MADVRKGCKYCKGELIGFRQKVLRTCSGCAKESREGIANMMRGNITEGFNKVIEMKAKSSVNKMMADDEKQEAEQALKAIMSNAINRKEKKIIKLAKKQGLNEKEILQALDIYREETKQ